MRFSYLLLHFHHLFLSFLHSFNERSYSTRANFYCLHMLSARQRWLRHRNLLREMRGASSCFKRQNSNYLYIRNFYAIACYLLSLPLSKLRHHSTKSFFITCICCFQSASGCGMECGPRHKKGKKNIFFCFSREMRNTFSFIYCIQSMHAFRKW